MLQGDQQTLIARYREAADKLVAHNLVCDRWSERYGLAYLTEHLETDLKRGFVLQDAFDDALIELRHELNEHAEGIPFQGGVYRVDALGIPTFFRGENSRSYP